MVLPRLGGSPAVWSVAMVFFQSLLLAGYAYAHYPDANQQPRDSGRRSIWCCWWSRWLTLPLSIASGWGEPPTSGYAFWLLGPVRGLDRAAVLCARRQQSAAAGLVRPHRPSRWARSLFPLRLLEYRQLPGAVVLSGAAGADVHAAHAEPDLDRRLRPPDRPDRRLRRAAAALAGAGLADAQTEETPSAAAARGPCARAGSSWPRCRRAC